MNNPNEMKVYSQQMESPLNNRTNKEINKENVLKLLGQDIKSIAAYLNENIQGIQLEHAPGDEAVKDSLYHTPKELEYLGQEIIAVEIEMKDKELDINEKKEQLKLTRAKKRKEIYDEYVTKSKDYMPIVKKEVEEFQKIFGDKLPSAIVQEIIRNHKPDKPTTSYLEDMAIITTEQEEKEIHTLEEELLEYKKMHMLLKLVEQKFIDKKFATMKHAGIIEAELRSYLS